MTLTDVPGIRAGHWSEPDARTGCTVVLAPLEGAVAGVDVRGSAPGTRETDLLRPTALVERVNAICLAGGSAFGLAAADGVMRRLRELGAGVETRHGRVPIVPAAVIFDLAVGSPSAYPASDQGYAATLAAELGEPPAEGRVGAGTGATVGKVLGAGAAMAGGIGTAGIRLPSGARVTALAVVNSFGDVFDRNGQILAGASRPDGGFVDSSRLILEEGLPAERESFGSTTAAVVATDARLTKAQCQKLAELSQDALALAIRPVHTMFDGDVVFALSCGNAEVDMLSLGVAAVHVLREAIQRSVRAAR